MIQFKKLIVHNFGSYGHAELDLQNRGFCLVSGQNNYVKDNALSNGSGKSFLWSAICYALTGETINGIRNNLKNINVEEQECYVQLDFIYNKDLISLVRYAAPKNDLKIFKNDIDLSGKGIRESDKKLQEMLPDLTKDLIASTIIIGQGMPNKFSSFSPSGRKELLEKLTKSDFMIEDLKTRIHARQQELTAKAREFEDSILVNRTQLNQYLASMDKIKTTLANRQQPAFDSLIAEQNTVIDQMLSYIDSCAGTIADLEAKVDTLNAELVRLSDEKATVCADELKAYTESYTTIITDINNYTFSINALQAEITKLQSIIDICPTCGQHLPNVHRPDTAEQERKLIELQQALAEAKTKLEQCNAQHESYISQINSAFNDELSDLNAQISLARQELTTNKTRQLEYANELDRAKSTLSRLVYDKQTWDSHTASMQKELTNLEAEVARLTNLIAITSISKEDFEQRLSVVKKMDLLIRRDFRGYLLANIIAYIDNKAKEYCSTVFGTKELSLSLNGNALDITYCGKQFDGLSGGEKQRVDLILQLAIRDLLNAYLGLSANILVLDEITDFLDKKSCHSVMTLLEKELKTIESVFIISHHSEELEIPIDSEIKVIKNACGISELS